MSADNLMSDAVMPETDEAFCEAFYDSHLTHALDAMREGVPYQINADGAFALIRQAAEDRRTLKALAASTPVGGWEDISTAPKDGTWIDLLKRSGDRTTDVRWVNEDPVHGPLALSGWKTRRNNQYSKLTDEQFTHWRPLPACAGPERAH